MAKRDRYILGVAGFSNYHDNSAVLVKNGQAIFAASEERFTREKHDPSFPREAIKAAFEFAGIGAEELDYVVCGWPKRSLLKTFLKKRRFFDLFASLFFLLREAGPRSLATFFARSFARERVAKEFTPLADLGVSPEKASHIDHHRAHAASAYRPSGFSDCLAVTVDAFGATPAGYLDSGSVWACQEGEMEKVESLPLEASLGLFYEAITVGVGFKPVDGEGKTMGLAVYGGPSTAYEALRKFAPRFEGGRWVKSPYWVDTLFSIDLAYKDLFLKTRFGKEITRLINETKREDVAAAGQRILEEEAVKFFEYLGKKYQRRYYATAGGVFLNVKMNKRIRELEHVKGFFTQPHAGDGGLALGAALELYAQKFGAEATLSRWRSAALGVGYSNSEVEKALGKFKGKVTHEKLDDIAAYTGRALVEGKVIGWFQGRFEWGPRALGQRSVFGDPRSRELKERINDRMKKREWFMPFAPSVMVEHTGRWFVGGEESPFMTMAYDVVGGKEKEIVAAIHIDNTGRPNTVDRRVDPKYWKVIDTFYKETGVPVVLNTSFNKHGLPIVNNPEDAIEHLLWGCVDELAIEDYLVKRA
jgi:carbamoyltransferase